jgi:DNA-binding transcriptional LysR family regulator
MPSVRQLKAFSAVMETRSISRAADILLLSQPAVSKLVQSLEAESGLRLFTRNKKRLTPTAEAYLYLNEAEILLQNLTRLDRLARDLMSMVHTNITVACYHALSATLMPRILHDFQKAQDGTIVTLLAHSSPRISELAIAQQFDVGISMLPVVHKDVISIPCVRREMVLIMRSDHRLAGRTDVDVEELAGEPFISLGHGDRMSYVVDNHFDRAGVNRKVVARVALSSATCGFVREGAGIALVDPTIIDHPISSGLASARLVPPIRVDTYLLVPRNRPPSTIREKFLTHLKTALGSKSPLWEQLPWEI